MTIGEKIKTLRKEQNMTQTDVAKQIGIATQTIFKYEKNIVTNIPLDNIEKLANLFNVSPGYLMGWNDETTGEKEKHTETDAPKENTIVYCRNGQTTEIELSQDKMNIVLKMIDALKDEDTDL